MSVRRHLITLAKETEQNFEQLLLVLTTGGHLIEFHLIESLDRIFRSSA